jgi:hypothetical protein
MKTYVRSTPDPLPHGATGTVETNSTADSLWCEVGLLLPSGDYTALSFLDLFRGNDTFTFGPTPTWDGTGGGKILLTLFTSYAGRKHTLAKGEGEYLA